ncbi:MAG: tannase/feruloyl esterase family alpha/beta hydrolase [Acidobacteriaceae bacterium]|nr:tannase/feruloyl esterase family alpha/beta hydrolase [Acidobacteriaceae bacterium]
MRITPGDWNRVKELFEAVLDVQPLQRAAFLAKNCDDQRIQQQVERLVHNYEEAGGFLQDPAFSRLAQPCSAEEFLNFQAEPEVLKTAATLEMQDSMAGRRLGAYKLVKRIGQGGMAAVFLAVRADDEYQKEVAIKLVQPGPDSRDLLNRFRNERQTLAALDHPNIVKLLDGGSTWEGLPYLVMDYVDGSPIDEYCDQHKLSVGERLCLFTKVCEAVQYAHQQQVIHRDLKPSNILVTAARLPKLLDFGIAKLLNSQDSGQTLLLTQTGMRCMTPAYASPEQMRGKSITTATDIYSLGVVLYELLTGHRPYRLRGHTPAEMERAILEQDPETPSTAISRIETETSSSGIPVLKTPELVSQTREGEPEKLRRRLRGDLDNILLKTLQKEPERRYSSVEELARDIDRHLQHLPVKARRSTLVYRASKLVQRHKTEVSAGLIVALMLAAAASLAFNMFGLRDYLFGGVPITRTGSFTVARSMKPSGRAVRGRASAIPVVSCESLAGLTLPNTRITLAQPVAAGAFTPSGDEPIPNLPDFCRVEGAIKPTRNSNIQFEVWLPSSGWNGKFRGVGNWGFAGMIEFGDMAAAVRRGYATASTDTGHRGDTGNDWDASWALGSPEKVVDFGYRAVHEMTEKAKLIIQAFYGQAPQRSFFEGCSNGGRQALVEAQRFPDDYQGILAGAAALDCTHLLTAAAYNLQMPPLVNPASYIPASKLPAISAAVLAACDALDGVTDGILNDPRQCRFDPSVLRCGGVESDSCLTSAQIAQLKRIYAGLRNSKGEQVFPGYMPGGEEGEEGWKAWITGPAPGRAAISMFGVSYLRYMVFDNPAWDLRTVSAEQAVQIAGEKTMHIMDATNPDLRLFKAHGGKLILYHGWSDPGVPALGTVNYYNSVVTKLGLHETESFTRLYMVPGMQHGYGGPGPNFFGQSWLDRNDQASAATDAQHNISSALEQWVENGIAPNSIIATKYVNDSDPMQGDKMTRPLCPYPQVAKYKGVGTRMMQTILSAFPSGNEAIGISCRPVQVFSRAYGNHADRYRGSLVIVHKRLLGHRSGVVGWGLGHALSG